MSRTSELIIGLNAGTFEARAAAFQTDGREIACAAQGNPILRPDDGGLECEPGEAWQTCARLLRRLAEQVPGLGGRTVALAITGPSGGAWPVDEDGDPVAPACLWLDARARGLVHEWRQSGAARAVENLTGSSITAGMTSAQLAWLHRHRPEVLGQAATVLDARAWLYLCCTGERTIDPAAAISSFGNLATGGYDGRVLDLLGLLELEPLLPDMHGSTRHRGALGAAPAAALGLLEGTPVVLAPADRLVMALAAGLDASGNEIGCSLLEPLALHMRIGREPAPVEAGESSLCTSIAPFPAGGFARAVIAPDGMLCVDWLVGMCEQLLVDAGLIGFPRTELIDLLERKAQAAAARGPSFQLLGDDDPALPAASPARARLEGLSGRSSLYAVLRAIYVSIGRTARIGHGTLGGSLRELRVAGEGARSALCRSLLGAGVGAPVRALQRSDAAAAGAALFATLSLGHHRDARASFPDWVLPHLSDPEPVDRELAALYDEEAPAHRQDELMPHGV
jgi:erythritol kinase